VSFDENIVDIRDNILLLKKSNLEELRIRVLEDTQGKTLCLTTCIWNTTRDKGGVSEPPPPGCQILYLGKLLWLGKTVSFIEFYVNKTRLFE